MGRQRLRVVMPRRSLLVQAYRGSQYLSEAFTQLLDRTQVLVRLSQSGNPDCNSLAESG